MSRSAAPSIWLRILAIYLLVRALTGFGSLRSPESGTLTELDLVTARSLISYALAIGAAIGLWRGRRSGVIYLSALLSLALTQFIYPVFPTDIIDQLFILIPIAIYSLLVIFAWHRTVP